MTTSSDFPQDGAEYDDDGVPRFQVFRNSAGHTWRQPIPERVRTEMRLCLLMDQLKADLNKAHVALAQSGLALIEHGGGTDPDALRQHWADCAKSYQTELARVGTPAQKLVDTLKNLLQL